MQLKWLQLPDIDLFVQIIHPLSQGQRIYRSAEYHTVLPIMLLTALDTCAAVHSISAIVQLASDSDKRAGYYM